MRHALWVLHTRNGCVKPWGSAAPHAVSLLTCMCAVHVCCALPECIMCCALPECIVCCALPECIVCSPAAA
eukprot:1161513-Pelagomonas_calceolata.AAC.2